MSTDIGTVLPRFERELVESVSEKKPEYGPGFRYVRFVVISPYAEVLPSL